MVWQRAVVCRGRGARGAKPAGRQEGPKCATLWPLGAHILEVCGILESELFDRIATFVDFGAHFCGVPRTLLQRACAAELAQGLVFCCACETMSQAYSHPPKCLPCVAFAARGYRCKYVTVLSHSRVSRSVLGRWCACDRVPWSNINYHYLSHCVLARPEPGTPLSSIALQVV